MIKKILNIPAIYLFAFAVTSCTTQKSLYSWYNYEKTTYTYGKEATPEIYNAMMEEYAKIGKDQKGKRGIVPPGFYAEYGYLLYKEGKKDGGLKYLNKEIETYPESKTYVSRIIEQIEKQ